jgi:hypothetical protein
MTILIGVDPAFRDKGFYVCSILGNLVEFIPIKNFLDFVTLVDKLQESGAEVYMCIENSNETNKTFYSNIRGADVREKISRDVGKNQAISQLSFDYAKHRLKYGGVYSVSPAEKGMKWSNLQVKASFKQLNQEVINYKGTVSEQDKRDAYKLALRAKYEYLIAQNKKK